MLFGLVSASACVPPLQLLCEVCAEGNTCGDNNPFICKEGFCVYRDNPDPAPCRAEYNEGGERAEPATETTPEESTTPEDGAPVEQEPTEQEPIREEGSELEIKETDKPYIQRVNGNSPNQRPVNAAASPSKIDNLPTAPTLPSPNRIKDALVIEGNLLDQIDRWVLQSKDSRNAEQTWANQQIQKDSAMKHTLSLLGRNLVAGAFLLLGFSANTQVVSADVFILQGEKGDAGAKGDIGDNKFTDADAALLKALLPKLKASGSKLVITADEISFESTAGTEAGKITIDSAKKELTFSTGTTVFSLTSTQITANASQISLTTPTFEVKGTATNPTTSLTLDDTARSVSLRVTQKNATTQATFSLEGGDANTSPAPATKYPLAIFNRTNIQVQSGEGSTTATLNGLGNLILGYNGKVNQPTAKRTGSHNLIVGDDHDYQNYGGFVSGSQNILIGGFSTVAGGSGSTASGTNSTVAGGSGNEAGRDGSSICSSVNVKIRITDPVNDPIRYCCGRF